jgi:hypothetical protein
MNWKEEIKKAGNLNKLQEMIRQVIDYAEDLKEDEYGIQIDEVYEIIAILSQAEEMVLKATGEIW